MLDPSKGRWVAVTGAAGFLGRAVVARLSAAGLLVRALSRDGVHVPYAQQTLATGDLLQADHAHLLEGCVSVVNCAARVHIMRREDPKQAEIEYGRVNAELPLALAEAAKVGGAQLFVQVSSAAAIASSTRPGERVTDATVPRPSTPYGRSKLAADRALERLVDDQFAVAALRPPAIYGPGAGAHFALFERAARAGLPLPLGRIDNARSFAFIDNVADAVGRVVEQPSSGAWLVTDSGPLSTAALYRRMLARHHRGDRVVNLPAGLVWQAARLALRGRAESLLGNAAFDGGRFAACFDWTPPTTLDEAIGKSVGGLPS